MNNFGTGGETGSKRGFGSFRGAHRLPMTTPVAEGAAEPAEVRREPRWNTGRRRQAQFETVMLPHLDAGYALARWLTRNDADAADVVQEACLRAFRYFDSYREGDAKSWLLKIVRRTSYDWLERNRPSEVVPLELDGDPDGSVHHPPAGAVDADALLESRSDLRRLDVLIES